MIYINVTKTLDVSHLHEIWGTLSSIFKIHIALSKRGNEHIVLNIKHLFCDITNHNMAKCMEYWDKFENIYDTD